ncbi:hypothetical protein A1F99_033690 [Pyrenophora tritici-repentis]|nr:hypothetical protein A1F99_033690 [Pyrenophora tritici-repentis]
MVVSTPFSEVGSLLAPFVCALDSAVIHVSCPMFPYGVYLLLQNGTVMTGD